MKQRAEIRFEIEETVVVRRGEKLLREFCPLCGIVVDMLTPQLATTVSKKPMREIFRLIEAGKLHFNKTDGGLICLNFLTASGAEQEAVRKRLMKPAVETPKHRKNLN